MTIYHINKAIGRASSGVEYAQKYRYDLVKDFPEQQFFVFCDHIGQNLLTYTDKIGIAPEFVLSVHKFMSGQKNHRSSVTVEQFRSTLSGAFDEKWLSDFSLVLSQGKLTYKIWLIEELGVIDRVDFAIGGRLFEVHYFSDRLTHIDFYDGSVVSVRHFFDENGEVSMRQLFDKGELALTFVDGQVLRGRNAFYQEFFRRLSWSEDDLIIVDRTHDLLDAIFPQKATAKLAIVIHAEHYSQAVQEESWVLWNNYYEYSFTNCAEIDAFIVSTARQKEILQHQFTEQGKSPRLWTIPVGFLSKISTGDKLEENKYKMLTVSRLAVEKHVDLLVKAVIKAKESLPELEFHIYGEGNQRKILLELIKEHQAESYISMHGHQAMEGEYEKYGVYLTASRSEGFGLTLLEALGACLPIIGLRVDYGNIEFISDCENGILLETAAENAKIISFAQAIVKLTEDFDTQKIIKFSQKKAQEYTEASVREKWRSFYDQMREVRKTDEAFTDRLL